MLTAAPKVASVGVGPVASSYAIAVVSSANVDVVYSEPFFWYFVTEKVLDPLVHLQLQLLCYLLVSLLHWSCSPML